MVMLPKVSIILPVFNAEDYLAQTIRSVLAQTFADFELIIVDDCSTDRSFDIAISFQSDARVKLFRLETNSGGPATPRNHGLERSMGKYIAFIDSDDLWQPTKLDLQFKLIEELNVFMLSTHFDIIRDHITYEEYLHFLSTPIPTDIHEISLNKKISFNKLLFENVIPNSSVLVAANAIKTYLFMEDQRYVAVEDYIMWCRLHRQFGSSVKINNPLFAYRASKKSISKNKFEMLKKRYQALSLLTDSSLVKIIALLGYIIKTTIKQSRIWLSRLFPS
jgi:teichuronic acid biosynthesis glycosyltransferase TuaG